MNRLLLAGPHCSVSHVCLITFELLHRLFKSLKQTTEFSYANFQKILSSSYIVLRIQRPEGNSVDLNEMAHFEPHHQDLRCLQIQLFSCPFLKGLRKPCFYYALTPFTSSSQHFIRNIYPTSLFL